MIKGNTYKINDLSAMSETLDDETIIINLENGNYYSLNKTATLIWNQIEANYSSSQIISNLSGRFKADSEAIKNSILDILNFLHKENLILETQGSEAIETAYQGLQEGNFIIPVIEKYEDMQEMLLADPIHDVHEMGWPQLKPVGN